MEIEIVFRDIEDDRTENEVLSFLFFLLTKIDDILYYTPDYDIKGRKRLKLTLFRLPLRETYKIRKVLEAELIEDGFIRSYKIKRSDLEGRHKMTDFTPPKYSKRGLEEVSKMDNFNVNIEEFVGDTIIEVYKTTYRLFQKELDKDMAPLTVATWLMEDMIRNKFGPETEDDIAREIAESPMYDEERHIKKSVEKERRKRERKASRTEPGPNGFIVPHWHAPKPKKKSKVLYSSKDSGYYYRNK